MILVYTIDGLSAKNSYCASSHAPSKVFLVIKAPRVYKF